MGFLIGRSVKARLLNPDAGPGWSAVMPVWNIGCQSEGVEVGFINPAFRADPILGDVFVAGTWRQTGIRVTQFFVIDPAAGGADEFFVFSHYRCINVVGGRRYFTQGGTEREACLFGRCADLAARREVLDQSLPSRLRLGSGP